MMRIASGIFMRASLEVWGGRIHCAPFRIVGVIARDATEIEAREKPVKKETNDKNDDPPPPDSAAPPRKPGRPRKDEQRPKPEPTRLERQTNQNLDQMLAELPTACDRLQEKQQGLQGNLERLQTASRRRLRLPSTTVRSPFP